MSRTRPQRDLNAGAHEVVQHQPRSRCGRRRRPSDGARRAPRRVARGAARRQPAGTSRETPTGIDAPRADPLAARRPNVDQLVARNADERTRTSTSVSSRRPERRASANSATSAGAPNLSDRLSARSLRRPRSPSRRPLVGGRRGPRYAALPLLPWHGATPLSSRGLGRRPLTAETGVRIPVAV